MSTAAPTDPFTLTRHVDAVEFAALVTPAMARREAANCLQLGLIDGMLRGQHEDPYLVTLAHRDRPHEALFNAIQTPPYRLILGDHTELEADPTALLAPLLADLPADLPGVLGPVELSRLFAKEYCAVHGLHYELIMSERVHQCTQVNMPAGVPGRMLRATAEHTPLLVERWRAFQQEAMPHEPDRAEASVARDLPASPGGLYVWEVGGRIVSLAGARGPTPNGIRIGPVYTPPELRGNGYAAALVGSLTQLLLDEGREFVFLFTNLANPTANALYRRLGYVGVADRSMYDFTNPPA